MKINTQDGQTEVTIGETFVGFKDGVEQYGRLVAVNGRDVVISVFDGDSGDRCEVTKSAAQCWVE